MSLTKSFRPLILSIGMLSISGLSSVAPALTCEGLFQQVDTKTNWNTHEANTAKELTKILEWYGLRGPASASGVIVAAMYTKSVGQDLQSEGQIAEAQEILEKVKSARKQLDNDPQIGILLRPRRT